MKPNDIEEAKKQTAMDLKKSISQLVTDFNEIVEILKDPKRLEKTWEENTKYSLMAQRYMVAMMAKVAISNNRMTIVLIVLTTIIAFLTGLLAFKC
jgi:hypothetical protein